MSHHAQHPQLGPMEAAVRTLLTGVGEDVTREGLLDTPKRVAKALLDVTKGYHQTPAGVLGSAYFHEPIVRDGSNGLVLVRDIDFASTSEETLLPFHGRCHIGYVPSNGVVLGLSKLARLTRLFSKRLQTQDRLGREVATALLRQLQCQGVAVIIEATHLSMVNSQPCEPITTACISGCFTDEDSSQFQEMLCMLAIDSLPANSLLRLPGSLPRSNSSLSDASSSAHAVSSNGDAQSIPLPPSTPDLSEHLSDSDHASLHSVHHRSHSKAESCSSDKCDVLSDHGSEKDLCDRDLGEQETGSDRLQLHPAQSALPSLHSQSLSQVPVLGIQHGPEPVASSPATPRAVNTGAGQQGSTALSDLRRCAAADVMEQAVLSLITAMGECPHRPGLLGSARRYVMTLLSATSGYARQLPAPLNPAASAGRSEVGLQQVADSASATCPCCQAARHHHQQLHGPAPAASSCKGVSVTQSSHTAGSTSHIPHSSAQTGSGLRHVKVQFTSQCEHHMLPFYGHAHVVYSVAALQTRSDEATGVDTGSTEQDAVRVEQDAVRDVVWMYTARLQVQERITHQVADAVMQVLGCSNALVLVDAAHMCMVARGVENHAGHTVSMAVRGGAATDAAWRARALAVCRAADKP